MALEFKTPEQIADEYLVRLKSLRPEINVDQQDSDWWIRSRVIGGVVSGAYSDIKKISDDAFPQKARRDALGNHLETYFASRFTPATEANGNLRVSGATGTVYAIGLEFLHEPTGNLYQATDSLTLVDSVTGSIPVESVDVGQDKNLLDETELLISAPPAGADSEAFVIDNITDGRDEETNDQARDRILARIRTPIRGGSETDYQQWALEADDRVVSSKVIRYAFGFGSVAVVITAGTTDIDAAIDAGIPVIQIPSDDLVDTVQAFLDGKRPVTDCVDVLKPIEIPVDVTCRVNFTSGTKDTILTGQALSQGDLVKREIERALYKTPVGGREIGASGFVLASEIEETIDQNLSATPIAEGVTLQIVVDRQVDDLSATGANRLVLGSEVAIPGSITIIEN